MLMIITTAMYDAWAAYDEKAVGTRLGGKLRRPKEERTEANKRIAIAYATYRAMLDLFPEDKQWLDEQMRTRGYDPNDNTTDVTKPQGIGNVAAAALLEYRHHDGANQLGDEEGSSGKPYSDYTFYRPVNPWNKIIDPDCWQPIEFTLADDKKVTPGFLTPHWYRVKPFALERSGMFRPAPPPKVAVLMYNGSLTLEQKAIVEFMRDGPRSTGQSGHWLKFAQAVSLRDKYDVDKDVKMFFAVGVTAFDAFIAAWEAKRFYDTSRPWTLIRYYYKDQMVRCRQRRDDGQSRRLASVFAAVVYYAAVSRLCFRSQLRQRGERENAGALHRQRLFRRKRHAPSGRIDRTGNFLRDQTER